MLFLLKRYKRSRILGSGKNKRPAEFVSLREIKCLCVVYYADSPQSALMLQQVVEMLEARGLNWKILLLERKRGGLLKLGLEGYREDERFVLVRRSELNWLGLPKSAAFENLLGEDISPYIIPNMHNLFIFDYIACKANTAFTVGMRENGDMYRMIIRPSGTEELSQKEFVEQALHNLDIMNREVK